MAELIAGYIKQAYDKNLPKGVDVATAKGQAKYRDYFIKRTIYRFIQPDVDHILNRDGYSQCIVTA